MTKIKKRGQSVVIPPSVDNSGFYITASKPVLVVAYVEAENVSSLGMIVLPPVQQGGSNFFFTSESPTMITIAVDACHLDNVLVNNFPPVGGAVVQPYPSVQMTDITTLSFKLPAGVHSLSLSNGKAFVAIGQSLDSAAIFSLGAYSNFINKVSRRRFYQPKAIGKGFALSDPSKVHKSVTVRHILACLDSCMQDTICHSVVFAVTGTQSGTCELTAYHTADLLVDDYISTGEHEIYSIKL
ncbi:uncharacterized protein LOC112041767 [Lingula anatina]|uniref:Uncharacterized protein LOC112041767 n=1 Tax=Lingula anatina TaxID=7574 RepID=A0A2R2MLR9_LINAN|nr:uncharacterized protein LOC112041767 [Lingula anatina]|eukprot:XP_023931161.1 uncharacterized protein LOC112041767 [Lingula anatina]